MIKVINNNISQDEIIKNKDIYEKYTSTFVNFLKFNYKSFTEFDMNFVNKLLYINNYNYINYSNGVIFNKDDKQGIYSGGFDVKSIMMKGGVSPIMTLNTQNGGGDTNKVSDLFGITVLLIQFIY
jgi:hypothetical protein